jgi:hypothetical protein
MEAFPAASHMYPHEHAGYVPDMFQVPTHWMCGCAMQYPPQVIFGAGGVAVAFDALLAEGGWVTLGRLAGGDVVPFPVHPASNIPIESSSSKSLMS